MKRTIERVNPNSAAKVASIAAALLMLLFFLIVLAVSVVQAALGYSRFHLGIGNFSLVMLVLPFFYMIGVYISSYLIALAMNIAARLVGGIQLELAD